MTPDVTRLVALEELGADLLSEPDGARRIHESVEHGLAIDAYLVPRRGATHLVCLLPSAQPAAAVVKNPVFHRWSWADRIPEAHVLVLSDPALYAAPSLTAHWFLSPNVDVIAALAVFVRRIASELRLSTGDVVTYGSSMGGFGAIMLATELEGSCAVAEVPQLDLREYPVKAAVRSLEEEVLGKTLDAFHAQAPERVSVTARMERAQRVPAMMLLTNPADPEFGAHIRLAGDLPRLRKAVGAIGTVRLEVSADASGHKPLPTDRALKALRGLIEQGWATEAVEEPRYAELIERATAAIGRIRFVRDEADRIAFDEAKGALLAAAATDGHADWPYLRLCSLTKTWTNSFNGELLTYARAALERRESLEAFIYLCRGIFYNRPAETAREDTRLAMEAISDPQVANIGRIFIGLADYELGDFAGYRSEIEAFRRHQAPGFEPYIAIPVSTVYTGRAGDLPDGPPRLLGQEIPVPAIPQADYTAVVSCDMAYFERFAEFIVRSFGAVAERGQLLVVVLGGSDALLADRLASWGATNATAVSIPLDCGDNVGPIASLVRFVMVDGLLRRDGRPVFVLDLDTVVKADLGGLLDALEGVDIASRILGYGVAPWEKYTGGFAVFMPTDGGRAVSGVLAKLAGAVAGPGSPQWWIDQNCFEGAIRLVQESGRALDIANVMALRDDFCVMPVGPAEAKLHILRQALDNVIASADGSPFRPR